MAIITLSQPTYQPATRTISDITNANPATITTTQPHYYVTGTIVRLYVPSTWGMDELDQQKGTITVVDRTSFTIDIDTSTYQLFVTPVSPRQYSLVVPIGEVSEILTAAVFNVLPYQ